MKKSSWTKPYLIVLTAITVVAVVVGTCMHAFNFFVHFNTGMINHGDSGELVSSSAKIYEKDISAVDIDIQAGDVEIIQGKEFMVEYDMPKALIPEIELKDGRLEISQKDSIGFQTAPIKNKCRMTVVLPENANIDSLTVDVNLGNLTMKGLSVSGDVEISEDMGNIEAEGIKCDTIDMDCNMGNIVVSGLNCNAASSDCDMGNVEITGFFNNLDADCDMGNVTINSENPDAVINANTDVGECKVINR